MITVSLRSVAPPGIVLSALKARAGDWRESRLPDRLRRSGVIGVECTAGADSVRLRYAYAAYGPFTPRYLVVTARVQPTADGGTAVAVRGEHRLTAGARAGVAALATVLLAVSAVALGWNSWPAFVVVLLVVGVNAGLLVLQNRELTREGSPAADHLVRRVEEAVAAADLGVLTQAR